MMILKSNPESHANAIKQFVKIKCKIFNEKVVLLDTGSTSHIMSKGFADYFKLLA
jgi:hypothetical protein